MFVRCGECTGGVGPGVPGVGGRELFSLFMEVVRGGGLAILAPPFEDCIGGNAGNWWFVEDVRSGNACWF